MPNKDEVISDLMNDLNYWVLQYGCTCGCESCTTCIDTEATLALLAKVETKINKEG